MKIYLTIVWMAIVTYLPRWVPLTILSNKKLPVRLTLFLKYIPYAALGALIFPDILFSTNYLFSAIAGMAMACIGAYFGLNVVLVVLIGILAAYGVEILLI
jgi:branched-subunit amino acid transport protein